MPANIPIARYTKVRIAEYPDKEVPMAESERREIDDLKRRVSVLEKDYHRRQSNRGRGKEVKSEEAVNVPNDGTHQDNAPAGEGAPNEQG